MGINSCIFEGNLGRDPELRHTPAGTAVCSLSVAVTEYSGKGDDKKKETTWVRVNVWEKQAESVAQYLKKGSHVIVEGRLRESKWQDQNGQNRTQLEVTASRVHFGPKRDTDGASAGNAGQPANAAAPRF